MARTAGQVDASIVTTQMRLQAQELGVGSLWVMHFDPQETIKQFKLTENLVPVAMLMLGYADMEATERHYERQSMEQMLLTLSKNSSKEPKPKADG